MSRVSVGWLVAVASLVLGACGSSDGILSPFGRNLTEARLNAAERRWLQHSPGNYRITESRSCECPIEAAAAMVVTVTTLSGYPAGPIMEWLEEVRYESDGSLVPEQYRPAALTVQQLFALVRDALDRHAARLDVEYDASYGYPTSISIDYDLKTVDDEITIRARDLQGLLVAVN